MKDYVLSYGLDFEIQISATLLPLRDSNMSSQVIELDAAFIWNKDYYCWFTLKGIEGGTDCYLTDFYGGEIAAYQLKDDWLEAHPKLNWSEHVDQVVETANQTKQQWCFRRSAGQPAEIALLYGFLASALAELTNGVVDSTDGAWDFSLFPATSEAFDCWYMRPEKTSDSDFQKWAYEIQSALL